MRTHLNSDAFAALLASPDIRAVSFDVFDTALVRTFARPADLFLELGLQLARRSLVSLPPDRFASLRVQAEGAARLAHPDGEPDLAEIYAALAPRLDWSVASRELAREAELALEHNSLVVVPHVRDWIQLARASGRRIAFVSDMYLPAAFIRELLLSRSLAEPGDPVLVSGEHRVSKAGGRLFAHLTAALDLPAAAILHVGDREDADVSVPAALGFRVLRVTETQPGFFEQSLLACQFDTHGLAGRLAAAARLARLARVPERASPALTEIGSGLLGPWLACFALWIFARAKLAGLRRLYFVSRDGQVMRELARAVQQRWTAAADIECRYLYGSRISWHHAAMTEIGDHQLRWLLNDQPAVNLAILAGRLGLPGEEVAALLAGTAAAPLLAQGGWNSAAIACVAQALREKSAVITAHPLVARRRALAREYFVQEGLFDGDDWAVVELGWSGSMMVSLHAALDRPVRLRAYYLNLSTFTPDLPASVELESFAINPGDVSFHLGRGLRLAEMIEVLTAADHGTVLGYEEAGDRVRPRLKTGPGRIWPAASLAALRAGATGFVAQLPHTVLLELDHQLHHAASARLLALQLLIVLVDFLRAPPAALARAFTECRFTEDPADFAPRPFVQALEFGAVLRSGWRHEGRLWAEGSLACSSALVNALARGGVTGAGAQLWHGARRRARELAGAHA